MEMGYPMASSARRSAPCRSSPISIPTSSWTARKSPLTSSDSRSMGPRSSGRFGRIRSTSIRTTTVFWTGSSYGPARARLPQIPRIRTQTVTAFSTARSGRSTAPILTDTDGDTLSDYLEVTAQAFRAEIDGQFVERPVVTPPITRDTDGDGLQDDEEWDGESAYGFLTDPSDPDTDRDGLSDHDE